jgi:tRNA pseudouridine55 synthase
MTNVFEIYKPVTKTPLEMISLVKEKYPEYKDETMGYAGRLDPMAEGVLLILVGEECKNRKSYELLPKEYEVEVLVGIETDSYDVMGIIQQVVPQNTVDYKLQQEIVNKVAQRFIGGFEQPYPPYSSVKVKGKSLFHWARENRLSEVVIPSKKVTIYSVDYLQQRVILGRELLQYVDEKVSRVKGFFRQEKIRADWHDKIASLSKAVFPVYKFRISCSSGTYMRSIAQEIGKQIGVPSLAATIKRTRVGDISEKDCEHLI